MAYEVTKQWSHGEYPTAAEMNKYSTSLNHINGLIPSWESFAVRAWGIHGNAAPGIPVAAENIIASMVHTMRWLVYKGGGKLYISATQTTSLPDNGGTNVFDLDTVPWLVYGNTYYISGGVTVALEDWEP